MAIHNIWNSKVPMVDPKTGLASQEFLRWMHDNTENVSGVDGDFASLSALVTQRTALTVVFVMNSCITAVNAGPELIAPRTGTLTKCKVVVKTTDPLVDLSFRIKKNGVNIFTTFVTVPAGTAAGTITTFLLPAAAPGLAVAVDDVFTIDITAGTAVWQITAVLE